jgi:hypothetical protein
VASTYFFGVILGEIGRIFIPEHSLHCVSDFLGFVIGYFKVSNIGEESSYFRAERAKRFEVYCVAVAFL